MKTFLKIMCITIAIAILMSCISITIYSNISKPEFYDRFMSLGNQYLEKEMYKEAVVEFNKAIQVDEKSTEARVGVAKGSIGLGDVKTAIRVLKEAQEIDIKNKKLLLEMVDILRDVAPAEAYELLNNYVDEVGTKKLDDEIKTLVDSANATPVIPSANPKEGEYVQPFVLQLEKGQTGMGHAIYYTTDGSTPDENSDLYTGSIDITEDTTVKFVGFNAKGDKTAVTELNYSIDSGAKTTLEQTIKDARALIDSAKEGSNPGDYKSGSKKEFVTHIEAAEDLLKEKIISKKDVETAIKDLEDAIDAFNANIIGAIDKDELETQISLAESLVASATEGDAVGNQKRGSKVTLNAVIDEAQAVLDDDSASQTEIDDATTNLEDAITVFKSSTVTSVDIRSQEQGATDGPVTVSLLWDTYDDLDLCVTAPNGETIYQGNRKDTNGGVLDLDAQSITFVEEPLENIYWKNAPSGTYTVTVKMSSDRNSSAVPYTIRTLVNGVSKLYNGSIANGTQTVCTFTY